MKLLPRQIFHTPILLGITLLFALFVCVPQPVLAQFYYEDAYYMLEEGYCAYESNVQDAFASSNPTPSSPSQIRGRQNIWEDEYEDDENLHPGDPLPLGDHTILFVLAAITAMVIFYKQRKRKQPSSSVQTLFTTLVFIFVASPLFALTNGDLRLQYIEQELKKDGKKTIINRLYHFESHTFTLEEGKRDTISVHIFNMIKGGKDHVNHPEIVLQEYDGSKWVDKEAHMIFGPLKGDAGMGLLPGRKNASVDSPVDDWVIQDGIENIKNDQRYADKGYRASGVWNFVVTKQDGKATFDMTQVHRHEGNFYVRVDGDLNYLNDTNIVTLSDFAYTHYAQPIGALKAHDYTHYDCKFLPAGKNVKFTIATEHTPRIAPELMVNNYRYSTDTQIPDPYVNSASGGSAALLPAAANVRFSWDIMTNRLTRAYIGDTKTAAGEYLVVHNEVQPTTFKYFQDNTNWMYSVDINAIRENKAVIRAKFKGQDQILWGTALTSGASFVGGTDTDLSRTYPLRLIYDFKDHRLVTIYNPNSEIAGEVNLQTPVMIHREHNNSATQLTFPSNTDKVVATGDNTDDKYSHPAYAVLTFLENKFATNAATSHYEKMFYWVSFPFDVNLKDVFGLGAYGDYWAVQYYNGERRAREGLPTEESTGWDYVAETKEEAATKVLKANTGYVVCLNYKRLSKDYQYAAGGGRKVSLYFPSANRVSQADIQMQDAEVTVNLEEYTKGDKIAWNHWNWHIIGVPSFATPGFTHTQASAPFFYIYDHNYDAYAAKQYNGFDFLPMHAYMFQYAGDIKWSNVVNATTPSGLAAKKNSAGHSCMLQVELQQAGNTLDNTFVQLREEDANIGFDLNLDLTKIINKGANIYTVVHGDQMAGNVVPAQESMIPLGVVITEAGEYTLTLPSNTNGVTVELVDYETGTSTNLLALDYTVRLTAGTHEGRFALRIQPSKVTTGVDNLGDEATGDKAKKYLIDGALYLVKDGVLYDAQGKLVR